MTASFSNKPLEIRGERDMHHWISRMIIWLVLLLSLPYNAAGQSMTPTSSTTPTPVPPLPPSLQPYGDWIAAQFKAHGWIALILFIIGFMVYWILKQGGNILEKKIESLFEGKKEKPLSSDEIQSKANEYNRRLETSPLLAPSMDPVERIASYLSALQNQADRPGEESQFVPLEEGLDLKPRVGLAPIPKEAQGAGIFSEEQTFKDLSDALRIKDPDTDQPYPAFVLLGEPGSGKSTLLRKLVREAVQRRLGDSEAPLPLFIMLSDHKRGKPLDFLRRHYQDVIGFDGLLDALNHGRVWLLADGLNEMERKGYDERIQQWREFIRIYFQPGGNRAMLTCRTADYGKGLELPRLLIHPMDDNRIQKFLQTRIPGRAKGVWDDLNRDRREGCRDLYNLATIPFWLVMLADASEQQGLPHNRARLIEHFIDRWLDYDASREGGCCLDESGREAFIDCLIRLGWVGLHKAQNYTFPEREATRLLTRFDNLSPATTLKLARDCSLIEPESKSRVVRFRHQLFQEYFAACELSSLFPRGKNMAGLWRIPWQHWMYVKSRWDPLPIPPSTHWEEATVMAAGMLKPDESAHLVEAVLRHNPPLAARCATEAGIKISSEIHQTIKDRLLSLVENPRQRLPLRLSAGKALGKIGDPRILKFQREVASEKHGQVSFIEPDWIDIPPGLFQMGSSRDDETRLKRQKARVYENEKPDHVVALSAYRIAKYPVTVTEYRCFNQAGGYENENYWPEGAARRWLHGETTFEESYQHYLFELYKGQAEVFKRDVTQRVKAGLMPPAQAKAVLVGMQRTEEDYRQQWAELEKENRDESRRACHPWLWDDLRFNNPSQPVIGVSWYEAQAYTIWLDEILHAAHRLAADMHPRLPTETEWERAARGLDNRWWPWGNRWNSQRCNSIEGRVMLPSPIGAYPQGVSPCGALDMAGNVWEWCFDWYSHDEYARLAATPQPAADPHGPETGDTRLVRGGSWRSDRGRVRCAFRFRNTPDHFDGYLGFRVVLSLNCF
jgi:formylglycine-generating enzyme required for sulfatase activity